MSIIGDNMPRGMKGRGFGRGPNFAMGNAYGAGYGRGFGRCIGARLGYCPYTGMPRGWRWYGYGTPQYNQPNYTGYQYPVQPYYRGNGK